MLNRLWRWYVDRRLHRQMFRPVRMQPWQELALEIHRCFKASGRRDLTLTAANIAEYVESQTRARGDFDQNRCLAMLVEKLSSPSGGLIQICDTSRTDFCLVDDGTVRLHGLTGDEYRDVIAKGIEESGVSADGNTHLRQLYEQLAEQARLRELEADLNRRLAPGESERIVKATEFDEAVGDADSRGPGEI